MMTKAKLKAAMTMMADQANAAKDVAGQLSVSLSTLYSFLDGKGQVKVRATELLRATALGVRANTPGAGARA